MKMMVMSLQTSMRLRMPAAPRSSSSALSTGVLSLTTSSQPALASTSSTSKRSRKQKHAKEVRKRNRAANKGSGSSGLKTVTLKRRRNITPLEVDLATEELGAASSGWIGGRVPTDKTAYTLEEVTKAPHNLRHVQWTVGSVRGFFLFFSLLADFGESERSAYRRPRGAVITVLAGRPRDPTWDSVAADAAEAIRTAGGAVAIPSRSDIPPSWGYLYCRGLWILVWRWTNGMVHICVCLTVADRHAGPG